MFEIIKRKLETLTKNSIVLVVMHPQNYQEVNLFLIKYWVDIASKNGVYVSLNRPYNNLIETLKSGKIDPEKLFFIDCVTKNELDIPNCYFLKTQQSLTNLSIAISTVVKKEKPSFIFIDSLNTLALYNEMSSAIKFSHFLISKLRTNNVDGILVGIKDEKNQEIILDLSQICDRVIDLTDTTFFI